ncbi:MAG: copper oxidase [Methylovulum miyakonense]|uniref:copper oxidase n=1 Tax=Methylovulum miyakonense TaxID=645578 RepID=UPI003BB67EA6
MQNHTRPNYTMKLILIFSLLLATHLANAEGHHHTGMVMDEKGMIMNDNPDKLPRDCTKLSETVDITIHAGQQYATKFNGKMFAFDNQEWNVKPCAKINITFINDDQIRHQLMIHGLPGYLYPDGMFHLELNGAGKLQASLIMPSQKKTYLVHCELPQHMEKGMKAQLKVDGGDGDLPSIPGISAAVNADDYPVDWTHTNLAILLLCVLAGSALPFLILKLRQP